MTSKEKLIREGAEIEREHAGTAAKLRAACQARRNVTESEFFRWIAEDHIEEDRNYYRKLKEAGL